MNVPHDALFQNCRNGSTPPNRRAWLKKDTSKKRVTSIISLKAPIATKVVCFSRLLKRVRSLYGKQCGPRSDCSYRSSLLWVHAVCFYTQFVSNVRQLHVFAADDFSRRHFQMHFFLGAFRVMCWWCRKTLHISIKKQIPKRGEFCPYHAKSRFLIWKRNHIGGAFRGRGTTQDEYCISITKH